MSIPQRSVGDVTVLDLSADVMTDISRDLFGLTVESLFSNGCKGLVLNLASLSWLNSGGIGLLVSAHRVADNYGARVAVAGANARILEVLGVMGMEQLLSTFAAESEAVASLQASE